MAFRAYYFSTIKTKKEVNIIVFPNAGVVNGVTYGHIGVVISENEIFEQNVSPIIVAQKTAFTTAINRSGSYVLMRPVANITDSGNTSSITGYGLYTSKAGVYIRESASTSANVKTLVPKGNELKIKYFIDGFQGDGWQWAATYYNGIEGFSRIETLNSYTVVETSTSVQVPGNNVCVVPRPLYIVMSFSGGNLRTSIPNGTPTFIPAGTAVEVVELINAVQSDGYQWVKAKYNGQIGYIQADTHNWHYFKTL